MPCLRPRRSAIIVAALFAAGVGVRLLGLPLRGTPDVSDFRVWTYAAATLGTTHVYRRSDGPDSPPLMFHDYLSTVDYPPMALYELTVAGRAYRALDATFQHGRRFRIAIKLLAVLGSCLVSAVVAAALLRHAAPRGAARSSLAFWLNPATILHDAFLGYIGALCAAPAIAALAVAVDGPAWAAGALLAMACLTKPQGLLVAPSVAVALRRRGSARLLVASFAALAAAAVCVWPFVRAGTFVDMCYALKYLVTDGTLSANGANLWWIVTYVAQTAHRLSSTTVVDALNDPVEILSIRRFLLLSGYEPSRLLAYAVRAFSWTMVLAVAGWATRQARRASDLARLAALGALVVHAYSVLAVQVHENHVYLAIPLLTVAAASRPPYGRLLACVSAIAGLNLFLFYGFGDAAGTIVDRTWTFIDATVWVAVANCAVFAWHVAVFRRACEDPVADERPYRPSTSGSSTRLACPGA